MVIDAFADSVRDAWVTGYRDGFSGKEFRRKSVSLDHRELILSDVYGYGHLAGREDAGDETGWGGIRDLKVNAPEETEVEEEKDSARVSIRADFAQKWVEKLRNTR